MPTLVTVTTHATTRNQDMKTTHSADPETVQAIIKLLQVHNKDGVPITADTDIAADLNLDSLAVMNLLMDIEERFDVSIPLNVVPEIRTVGELAQAIVDAKEGT